MDTSLDIHSQWQPSLWADTATPSPICPPLPGDVDTEVAVVGAGYTGLSAALHLAEAGRQVTVLDRFGPGWGCSGRNGGQVNPAWKLLPDDLEAKLGAPAARRGIMMANDACDLVFDLVGRFSIDCEAIRPGYVQGAYGDHGARFLREWVRQWAERDITTTLLDRDTIADMLGTPVYSIGMHDARGGSVQPLSYARGLARAAIAAGADLHGDTAVTSAGKHVGDWVLTTSHGDLRARHVLWCTNGYTDDTWPGLRESVVPVTSFIVATEPLSQSQLATVMPGRHAVSETARIQVYYRVDGSGRMVFGGRGNNLNTRLAGGTSYLEQQAIRMFPALEGVGWEYRWGGHPAMTPDYLPRLMKLDDNVWAGLGYNGRGIAMGTMLGRELSHAVVGGETALEITPLRAIPFHRFRQLGISWHILTGRLLDLRDGA